MASDPSFPRPPGWGVDVSPQARPGVPLRFEPPRPAPGAHVDIAQQPLTPWKLQSVDRQMTPVFGTRQPPKLLSGVLKRVAYGIPQYKARRWMLLLLSDRVDVLEHRLGKLARAVVVGGAAAAGGLVLLRLLQGRPVDELIQPLRRRLRPLQEAYSYD